MTIPQDEITQDDAPLWRVIADQLRDEIGREIYAPGAPLPGETAMAERYNTSRPTVRRAIAELAGEGLISAAQGRGTFVRARPDRRAIIVTGTTHADLFDEGANLAWLREDHPDAARYRREHTGVTNSILTGATREQAEALRIETGAWILYRFAHWRHRITQRVIAVTSVTPAHLTGSSSLLGRPHDEPEPPEEYDEEDYDNPPASWAEQETPEPDEQDDDFEPDEDAPDTAIYDALAQDHGPVHFTTTVTARMPHGDELNDLGTEPGIPLLVIRRTMNDRHGRPLEVTQIEAPADRIEALTADPDTRIPTAILTL